MPPAAVDFHTQSTRQQQHELSFDSQNLSSRFPFDSTSSSQKPSSKPRPLRRRHVVKANTVYNPASQSCLDDRNRSNNDVTESSNGFVFGSNETSLKNPNLNVQMKQSNKGFVSGAENSFSELEKKKSVSGSNGSVLDATASNLKNNNLNVERKHSHVGFSGNGEFGVFVSGSGKNCSNLKKTDSVSGFSNGFVFRMSESYLKNPNLNVEKKQSNMVFSNSKSEYKEPNKNDEFGKFLSGGFVSDAGKSFSNLKKPESVSGLSKGVVYGMSEKGLGNPGLNVEMKESDICFSNTKCDCNESNKNDGLDKHLSGGFVFGTENSYSNLRKNEFVRRCPRRVRFGFVSKQTDPISVSNSNKEESAKKIGNLTSQTKENAEVGLDSGFGGNWFESGSTFIKNNNQNIENGQKSVPVDREKMKSEARVEVDSIGSVFGSSLSSIFQKVFENVGEVEGDSKSKLQKKKIDDVFVFGSNIKENSSSRHCNKLPDEINKPNAGECMSNSTFDNSFVNNKHNFVFGSTTDKLSDEMRKLSVENSDEMGKFGGIKEPFIYSFDPVFVFGSGVKPSGSSTGKLETTNIKPPINANEKSCNNISVGISTPKSLTFQADPGKSFAKFEDQVNDGSKLVKNLSESFSENLFNTKEFSMGRVEGKENFSFMSTQAGAGSCDTGFKTPNKNASNSFAENLNFSFSKYPDYSRRIKSNRNRKSKKPSHKSRTVDPIKQQLSKNSEESQNTLSPGHFSPMDFSPSQEDQCVSSINATNLRLARDEAMKKRTNTSGDFSKNFWEKFAAEYPLEQAETVGGSSRTGQISTNNDDNNDGSERNFGFFPISKEDNVSARKSLNRKKYRKKVGCSPNNIDPRSQVDSSYLHLNQTQNKERNTFNSNIVKNNVNGDEEYSKQQSATARNMKNNVQGDEAQNACEKWRIRGNQAYEKGDSIKAEEYYTKGIKSFKGSPECSNELLVLCYSNRAAARMQCGRMREALDDCILADSMDPSFQKVQLRAANCHLALGEIEEACRYFTKCLSSKGAVCLDRRIAIEAASGLQKAQKLDSCLTYCAELLRQKTSAAANSALENIFAVFSTNSYSEKLLELKGEALLMLQRYKEVIQLCEQTLVSAEKNFATVDGDINSVNNNAPNSKNSKILLWRWRLISKSHFYLGKLELSLDFLEKQEALASCDDRSNTKELSVAATVRELLHRKNAGNRAFQCGKYTEAVEHYSAAVSSNIESRPFAAVCFCNRAAAQQALGQLSDAISDCSISIALDGTYSKAFSRRAALHEKIRDYDSAACDLRRLISLLKEKSQNKNCESAGTDISSGNNKEELNKAHRCLTYIEEKAKKGISLDHYLILGVKSTDEASEMKKAYRRAALRHHPDKAGQFLARGDNGDDGRPWKEICDEIQKDADRLFKMIGEAYAVLSDPDKRSEYEFQEELRNTRKENNRNRDSTRNNGRYSQEYWRTYGYSHSQW